LQAGGPEFESLQVHHDSPLFFFNPFFVFPLRLSFCNACVMKFVMALFVLLAGLGVAFQTGMNAQLRASFGSGLLSALVSFTVGLLGLIAMVLLCRVSWPSGVALTAIPLWAWFGGLLGAFFIAVAAFCARDLGAGFFVILVTLGQIVGSVLIDHYGLVGMPVRPISFAKISACVLLVASVALLSFSEK
jgi:transporter family-2 protein